MAYRLGVDVGGTFTDLFLVERLERRRAVPREDALDPGDPSEGVLAGVRRICDEAEIDVGDLRNILHGTTVATNAVLESKGARVGLITTQGFEQILHLARSQTPGPLAGWIIMIKPDPPALARRHARGRRADGRARRHGRAGRRGAGRGDRPRPRRVGRRVAHRRARQLLRVGAARRGDRRDRRAPLSGLPGDALVGGAARVPRVRANADGVHELVRAADGRDLRRAAPEPAPEDRRPRRGEHPPLGRRPDDDAGGGPQPDLRRPLRPVRRCRGRSLRRSQGRLRRHPHVRHGRHVDRRRALPERAADDRSRDLDRPLPDQGAVRQRAHRRARAAARSRTCPS